MNNRPDKRDQLLADLYLRESTVGLEKVAKTAARRIRRRRGFRATAVAVAIFTAVMLSYQMARRRSEPTVASEVPSPRLLPPSQEGRYEIISDEQLSNLLKTQSVLVTSDPNGRKRVILLSQTSGR